MIDTPDIEKMVAFDMTQNSKEIAIQYKMNQCIKAINEIRKDIRDIKHGIKKQKDK
jgi:hypothetical protein